MMISKGGRPLRSCDFPAGIVFFGRKEDELWHPSKDTPPTPLTSLVHRHILRIPILVERNLIYLINQDWKKESKKEGTIRLGEECCWGNGLGRACSLVVCSYAFFRGQQKWNVWIYRYSYKLN